jgi:hypothetical protein
MSLGAIVIIVIAISLCLVWLGLSIKHAPTEEELWPDLKREFKGQVWKRTDYLKGKAACE